MLETTTNLLSGPILILYIIKVAINFMIILILVIIKNQKDEFIKIINKLIQNSKRVLLKLTLVPSLAYSFA